MIVLVAVVSVMLYRIAIVAIVYAITKGLSEFFSSNAKLLISLSAATLNLILIVILNKVLKSASNPLYHVQP